MPTPDCPDCAMPPEIVLDGGQSFCGNLECPVLSWDATCDRTQLDANRTEVWIGLTPGECVRGIGRRVEYRPAHARRDASQAEFGVIQEVRGEVALVLYEGDRVAKATYPRDLVFARK